MPTRLRAGLATAAATTALLATLGMSPASAAPLPKIDKSMPVPASTRLAIDAAAADFLANSLDKTPAVWVAVWDPAQGYFEQAYGKAVVPGTAASVADHLRIGSITKTVFATAVLQAVAAGRLSLTATVQDLDPQLARAFPKVARYTVAQLLGMRTRIPDYADAAVAAMASNPQRRFTSRDLISLAFEKGKKIPAQGGYSTTNYIILGEVMQHVTGKTPADLVNGVFRQAGMSQSRLIPGSRPMPEPAAHGYLGTLGTTELAAVNPGLEASTDVGLWPLDWGREGGGAYSTIGDLATWGGTCLGNTLLAKSIVGQRLRANSIDAGLYGLGITRQGDWLAHSGQVLGFTSNVACNAKTGAVVAYVTNSTYGTIDLMSSLGVALAPDYVNAS